MSFNIDDKQGAIKYYSSAIKALSILGSFLMVLEPRQNTKLLTLLISILANKFSRRPNRFINFIKFIK
jgi:hypothetical protein